MGIWDHCALSLHSLCSNECIIIGHNHHPLTSSYYTLSLHYLYSNGSMTIHHARSPVDIYCTLSCNTNIVMDDHLGGLAMITIYSLSFEHMDLIGQTYEGE